MDEGSIGRRPVRCLLQSLPTLKQAGWRIGILPPKGGAIVVKKLYEDGIHDKSNKIQCFLYLSKLVCKNISTPNIDNISTYPNMEEY